MTGEVVGRQPELDAVERFLGVVSQHAAGLLLDGPAGIGKTTIWQAAVDRAKARRFTVLETRPAEVEASFSFAGLGDLLDTVLSPLLPLLPAPQARALEVTLFRADDVSAVDSGAVAYATLGAVRALAGERPVVIAVDDLQWLDPATMGVLVYVLRRVARSPVGLLATRRTTGKAELLTTYSRLVQDVNAENRELRPLTQGAIGRVIQGALGDCPSLFTVRRIHRACEGNPLYALELARRVLAVGEPAPDESLPIPERPSDLLLARVDAQPDEVRECLLLVACLASPDERTIEGVMAARGTDVGKALSIAREAGLIDASGLRIRLSHPLLAACVYSSATDADRRRAHRDLAKVVRTIEERARHLALAAAGPSEEVAEALDAAAVHADRFGAPAVGAELSELAARLTPASLPSQRHRRLLQSGIHLHRVGDWQRAQLVLRQVVDETDERDTLVRTLLQLAETTWASQSPAQAEPWYELALTAAGDDPELLARGHVTMAEFSDLERPTALQHARAALQLLEGVQDPDPLLMKRVLLAVADREMLMGAPYQDILVRRFVAADRRARADAVDDTPVVLGRWRLWHDEAATQAVLARWLLWYDEIPASRAIFEAAMPGVRARGDTRALLHLLLQLGRLETVAGSWSRADDLATEAIVLAEDEDDRLIGSTALFLSGFIAAHLGRPEVARARGAQTLDIADRLRDPWVEAAGRWVLGFVELSEGDFTAAEGQLSRADTLTEQFHGAEPITLRFHADHIEALVGLGELGRAEALTERLTERAQVAHRPWALAAAARSRALLLATSGDLAAAMEPADAAVDAFRHLGMPFELGRSLLVKGQVLRRARRRRESRQTLAEALGLFDSLPAPAWAKKARADMARLGGRAPASASLTPTERRVADLAAEGRTSAEIASELFISVATVGANLTRVYRKLGIRAKTQLAVALRREDEAHEAAGPSR